ncbi:hypothetical protein BC939DRAFT_496854 [Gamsiella multidivaricata]|uniref:uncharacterized protein n=1 Tax=Gamsiella multidivaricata TaxID=101098 RepID=UPI002220E9A6|nr:uncharacterized protein BC939DRAFT_496854 [Gamsiella multidivaricata]KAI7817190.1 hypothetical protein BC939DRAFT_496854 [Gamsiella multidivaricata]
MKMHSFLYSNDTVSAHITEPYVKGGDETPIGPSEDVREDLHFECHRSHSRPNSPYVWYDDPTQELNVERVWYSFEDTIGDHPERPQRVLGRFSAEVELKIKAHGGHQSELYRAHCHTKRGSEQVELEERAMRLRCCRNFSDRHYAQCCINLQQEIERLEVLVTDLRGTLALFGDPSEAAEKQSEPNDEVQAGAEPSSSLQAIKRNCEANGDSSEVKPKARRKSI